jgi:hypothetical protein
LIRVLEIIVSARVLAEAEVIKFTIAADTEAEVIYGLRAVATDALVI